MKLKTLVVTVVVLLALSIATYFVTRPAPPRAADPRVQQPLVDGSIVDRAAKIRLQDSGKEVVLAKQADGSWRVPSYYDFPADFQKLSMFIEGLTNAKVQQLVTSNPERLRRLEFKDTQIALLDPGDKALWSITVGKNAEAGGRFIRFNDEPKGYRANLSVWIDPEAKSWADSNLSSVKPEDVAKVEIEFPGESPVVATRAKKEDAFSAAEPPSGQQLKSDRITSLVSSLTSLRFNDTSDPSDSNATAAKQHQRTVRLTTFDGKTVSVALGRKPEQKIIKPPSPKPDGTSGPAALGSVSETGKTAAQDPSSPEVQKAGPAKVIEPETETVPAGPVFAFISQSDPNAPINALMAKRSFQVYEYAFTGLPQARAELFEPAPSPASTPAASNLPPDAGPAAPTETPSKAGSS